MLPPRRSRRSLFHGSPSQGALNPSIAADPTNARRERTNPGRRPTSSSFLGRQARAIGPEVRSGGPRPPLVEVHGGRVGEGVERHDGVTLQPDVSPAVGKVVEFAQEPGQAIRCRGFGVMSLADGLGRDLVDLEGRWIGPRTVNSGPIGFFTCRARLDFSGDENRKRKDWNRGLAVGRGFLLEIGSRSLSAQEPSEACRPRCRVMAGGLTWV